MAFFKFLTLTAFAVVLLLDLTAKTDACTCHYVSVCEDFRNVDFVVLTAAKSRSKPMGTYGDITYTLENTHFFKGAFPHGDEVSFTTAGQSAACGTYLELGGEVQYLMGLTLRNGIYTADICGLDEDWETVSDKDKASVEAGCADELCDVTCNEFQECLFHNDHLGSQYYCADVCDPSPCEQGETCTLEQLVDCLLLPCPPSAVCSHGKI